MPQKAQQTISIEAPADLLCVNVILNRELTPYRLYIRLLHFTIAGALSEYLKGENMENVIPIILSLGFNAFEADR